MIKNYKEALEKIFTYEEVRDYSLERVVKAVELLWNPLKNIKVIHIAWTNWKWSVSKMVFSSLKKAWKKVWAYTSPHLVSIRERFITENGVISKKDFVSIFNKIESLPFKLSYFEKTTLISFLYFKKESCEYAIIEVWFWWLLDSTNVVSPTITAITSIWFDHKEFLWDTIDKISYQKAGIIKKGIPIIYNHKNDIIKRIALEKDSKIIFTKKKIKTNLLWDFQEENAWIAYEICKSLWISEKSILDGLKEVEHHWRLEYIRENLLIDWSHNEDSLLELNKYLEKINNKWDKVYLCFSLKQWKKVSLITDIFGKNKNYILIKKSHLLVEDSLVLEEQMKKNKIRCNILETSEIDKRSVGERGSLYVVFGSLYMIWEFYK